jgi:hypothetical protein
MYGWQPDVVVDPNWRPYWTVTGTRITVDLDHMRISPATYHYGRWANLADYGWVWPGKTWIVIGLVSWRTGGDYIGWAPCPRRDRASFSDSPSAQTWT